MDAVMTAKRVQELLDAAVASESTDVHLTVRKGTLLVLFRIKGRIVPFGKHTDGADEVIRRIKAMAKLDVTSRYTPQDGSFTWDTKLVSVRFRASFMPIHDGESLVLRAFHGSNEGVYALDTLRFTTLQMATIRRWMSFSHGLHIVAGHTGVGKTTTLYAMMVELANQGRQVFSIEDPVEMPIPHCRQIEVHPSSGLTYAVALRGLLRQDPDVLMVGEIRDEETAQVACRAALTGRFVLATTHAEGLGGTTMRLQDLGVPLAVVQDVLRGVITQYTGSERLGYQESAYRIEEGKATSFGVPSTNLTQPLRVGESASHVPVALEVQHVVG